MLHTPPLELGDVSISELIWQLGALTGRGTQGGQFKQVDRKDLAIEILGRVCAFKSYSASATTLKVSL